MRININNLQGTSVEKEFNELSPLTLKCFRVLWHLPAQPTDFDWMAIQVGMTNCGLGICIKCLRKKGLVDKDDLMINKMGRLQLTTCRQILENIIWRKLK